MAEADATSTVPVPGKVKNGEKTFLLRNIHPTLVIHVRAENPFNVLPLKLKPKLNSCDLRSLCCCLFKLVFILERASTRAHVCVCVCVCVCVEREREKISVQRACMPCVSEEESVPAASNWNKKKWSGELNDLFFGCVREERKASENVCEI